jgi:hypothetical protein
MASATTTARTTAVGKTKPKALSVHIGLNGVSPAAYGGWDGPLAACEFDANDMAAIAKSRAMTSTTLLTKKATRANALSAIRAAAKSLKTGDLFLLTYSGHGGQVPDVSGDEDDKQDETWCLYDGQLIDDELYLELSRFAPGVRVLVLSDSCHSGTVTRAAPPAVTLTNGSMASSSPRPKLMPPAVAMRTYREHRAFYDKLQLDVAKQSGKANGKAVNIDPDTALANVAASGRLTAIVKTFKPALVLISGCQDNQTSMDGDHNGAFTEALLRIWNNGAFVGNYGSFHARIRASLPASQSPNLFALGKAGIFLAQEPFAV